MLARTAALFLLLTAPLLAHTVPSMQNGSFDHGLLPWAVTNETLPTFQWTLAADANGSTVSRSAEIGIRPDSNATRTFMYQCIQIDRTRVYEAGVRVFIPLDQQTGRVGARLAVRWFANSECSGEHLSRFLPVASVTKAGQWTDARLRSLTAPPTATHVAFSVEVTRDSIAVPAARARFDDAYFVTAEDRLIVPAVASLHGAAGSVWSSDLYLVNVTDAPVRATLLYRCEGACALKPREVTIPARESLLLSDIVATTFESTGSSGAIEIFHDGAVGALVATSRLHSRADRGYFGTEVAALRESELGSASILPGLRNGSAFRTNIGVYNGYDHDADVALSLFVDGKEIGQATVTVASRALVHMNAFALFHQQQLVTDNAYVRVEAKDRRVVAFASVIDNATNDVAFTRGVKLD